MKPFTRVTGTAAVLDRADVDTDQIMPKQFLKRIERTGFGEFLFFEWAKDPDFELNRPECGGAKILLAGRNFGCGSSREHAVWALEDYGVRAVLAPSFGDIFASNALRVGLLPVRLPQAVVERWMDAAREEPGLRAVVDLEAGYVEFAGEPMTIDIDAESRRRLLGGLDEIGIALQHDDAITAHETRRPAWLPTSTVLAQR